MSRTNLNGKNDSEKDHVQTYLNNHGLKSTHDKLRNAADSLGNTSANITTIHGVIDDKRQRLIRQEAEIAQKKKIILTRNRMLNISEANNRYNQKLIYTFVSIVFGLFIIMLVLYTYNNKNYSKKSKVANSVGNSNGNGNGNNA